MPRTARGRAAGGAALPLARFVRSSRAWGRTITDVQLGRLGPRRRGGIAVETALRPLFRVATLLAMRTSLLALACAALVASPGLAKKRRDLAFDRTLGDVSEPEWAGDLDQVVFPIRGNYLEVVFLHRSSRTLILTDLCFQIPADRGLVTSVLARAFGYYERFAVSRLLKLMLADRAAARQALERILAWDFDRVIIAHGEIVESGGKSAMERAFAWLFKN